MMKLKFKEFLREFNENAGEFYMANSEDITKSDFMVVVDTL